MDDITLQQATATVKAALDKAGQIGAKMNIAVVDAGANLKAFARMDGAWLGSIDISIRKARTARFFDMPSGEIGKLARARRVALQHRAFQRRFDHLPRRRAHQERSRHGDRSDRRFGKHRGKRSSGCRSGGGRRLNRLTYRPA